MGKVMSRRSSTRSCMLSSFDSTTEHSIYRLDKYKKMAFIIMAGYQV